MDRSLLIASFEDTMNQVQSDERLQKLTEKAMQNTIVYLEKNDLHIEKSRFDTNIIVESNTTFSAAKKYLSKGKTAVLNFANPENAGGGVVNGAMAQEECLCRSSNLFPCLSQPKVFAEYYQYHRNFGSRFYSDRLIYTNGVTVFKDDSIVPTLKDRREWFQVDVITCAAPYLAKRKYTNKAALKQLFKGRISYILGAAVENKIEVLILGAFGCGAFKNPPEVVAAAFKEVIEVSFDGVFKAIVFAIKSTTNDDPFEPCPNIMAFEREFYTLSGEANKLRFTNY